MKIALVWQAIARIIGTSVAVLIVSLAGVATGLAAEPAPLVNHCPANNCGACSFSGNVPVPTPAGKSVTVQGGGLACNTNGKTEMATVEFTGLPAGVTWTKQVPVYEAVYFNSDDFTFYTQPNSPHGFYKAQMHATSPSCPGGYFDNGAGTGMLCFWYIRITGPPPKISCAESSKVCAVPTGPQLWWFNGVSPNPKNYRTVLKVTPEGTKYTWTITTGSDYAQFSDGSSTLNLQGTNLVAILPKGDPGDDAPTVSVTVTVTSKEGTATSLPFNLTVRKPYELFPKAVVGHAADATNVKDFTHPSDCTACAYYSEIHYQIRDQTGAVLPFDVPLNEHFTTAEICDYMPAGTCATNWITEVPAQNCGDAHFCPYDQPPSNWVDGLGNGGAVLVPKALPPGPLQKPPTSLGVVKIRHFSGTWGIGDGHPGNGVTVQTNTWQDWQDHGRHCGIQSPPGSPTEPGC